MRRLIDYLPIVSKKDPYSQIVFVFTEYAKHKKSSVTKDGYRYCMNNYIRFVSNSGLLLDGVFEIGKQWDSYCFIKYSEYLNNQKREGKYTSNSVFSYLNQLRQVLKFAQAHKLTTGKIIFIRLEQPVAETDSHAPLSSGQFDSLDSVLKKEVDETSKGVFFQDYIRKNVGNDPRLIAPNPHENPWKNPDNKIWYFENVMNCQPFPTNAIGREHHRLFFRFLGCPLRKFYLELGLIPGPDLNIIPTYAFFLARITGLNTSSLIELDVNCIQQDRVNDFVFFRYFKRRSTGTKVLRKDLIGRNEFEKIESVVDFVTKLTEPYRDYAIGDLKNRLFIIDGKWGVRGLSKGDLHRVNYNLKKKYNLNFSISIPRIRATQINDSLSNNTDLTIVQEKYGHEWYTTTLGYGSKSKLEKDALENTGLVLTRRFYSILDGATEKLYKTSLAHCIDPFNPPFSSAKPPCTLVHKCLSCANFRFSINDIASILSYYLSIKSNKMFQLKELPNQTDYEQTVIEIEHILIDNNLKLSTAELQKNIQNAIAGVFNIDPIVS